MNFFNSRPRQLKFFRDSGNPPQHCAVAWMFPSVAARETDVVEANFASWKQENVFHHIKKNILSHSCIVASQMQT